MERKEEQLLKRAKREAMTLREDPFSVQQAFENITNRKVRGYGSF
jgi:hypothetical protein